MTRISSRDFAKFTAIAVLLLAWSSLPVWAGYLAQDNQALFGGTYLDPQDYAVHLTMMRAGMQGDWGYNLRFTTEAHPTVYIRMFYIALGEFNRLLQVPPEALYQTARWVFGYTALLAVFILVRRCFFERETGWQWPAFVIVVLGSGLGWLQRATGWVPSRITPIDYWLIDAYFLFSLSLFPHFAFTLTLMTLAFVVYADYLERGGWLRVGVVILTALLVQLVNPVAFIVVDVAMVAASVAYWARSDKASRSRLLALPAIAVAQAPLFLYSWLVLTRFPVWAQFTAQNQTPSPSPVYYLLGFGLLWPLAVVGAVHAIRRSDRILISALAWVIGAFILAYVPFPIQRRFLLGITIPLGLLAARGLADTVRYLSAVRVQFSKRATLTVMLACLLLSVTTVTLSPVEALYMSTRPEGLFYATSLVAAFNWISADTGANDAVLSSSRTGLLIGQFTGRRVFLGHDMETLDYAEKVIEVEAFYRGDEPNPRVLAAPVTWVFYGPYERQIAPDFNPGANLEPVFRSSAVTIYRNLSSAVPALDHALGLQPGLP